MADNGALDVPELNAADLIKPNPDGYFEDEGFRPDPLYQYVNLDTSDTAGGAHQRIEEVSPIFAAARIQNLNAAAKALDPENDSVPAELVTLRSSDKTVERAKEELAGVIRRAAENPVLLGGPTAEQQKAAQE